MTFTVHDVEQRSPEWAALRSGLVTGSCAPAILAVRKRGSGELAVRRDLRHKLVCERLTGMSQDKQFDRTPDAISHGLETEPDAVRAYEVFTGQIVRRVGFVSLDGMAVGCSPDGYVGDWEGLIETKCPHSTTHLDYLKANVVPEEYAGQLIHSLFVTGAQWVDFVSFDPRFRQASLQLFIKRLRRQDVDLDAYARQLRAFLDEVETELQAIRTVSDPSQVLRQVIEGAA